MKADKEPAVPSENSKRSPLKGIRVLDLTRVLSGPFCTALLSDLGAEVIKIEPPQGDDYRHVGPFREGESALFTLVNRNKKSVVADMKDAGDRAGVLSLAADIDVVVENFKPGVADRLGIGFQAVQAINPDIVYASISGFGQTGTLRDRPAFDLVVQAMSGIMSLTGEPDGPPTKVGESFGDLLAGLYTSWAIMAALFDRERTGEGAYLDVAMLDCLVATMPTPLAQWMFSGTAPTRVGNRHPLSTPFGAFKAKDGFVVIAVLNTPQFEKLCQVMGTPGLAADPRFGSDETRTRNEPVLRALIETWLQEQTIAEALAALAAAGVPASPIFEMTEAIERAASGGRPIYGTQAHPKLGTLPMLHQPVRSDAWAASALRPAPALGEHTSEYLGKKDA